MSADESLITDQIAYYRAPAGEYDDTMRRPERYVRLGQSTW